jgi:CRP/FNR family transcriptional regulator
MKNWNDIREMFKKAPMFSGIPDDILSRLFQNKVTRRYKSGDVIIQQGKSCEQAFILVEGRLKICSENCEGMQTTILYHSAPFLFGEIEIIDQFPYTASVIALEPSQAIVMSRAEYISMLHGNHQFCFNVTRLLSKLLYEAGEDRRLRVFGQVEHLLASGISALAVIEGEPHQGGVQITRKVNKTELASTLGVARKSVIGAFDQLIQKDLIRLEGEKIFIPNLTRLQQVSKKL